MIITGGMDNLAFLVIYHGKGLAILALGWLALAVIFVFAYHGLKRVSMRRLTDVWGDYMPETPEVIHEDTEPMPPAVAVKCPTCHAEPATLCVTTISNLPTPICHMSRAARYESRLAHRRNVEDALHRGG